MSDPLTPAPTPEQVAAAQAQIVRDVTSIGAMLETRLTQALNGASGVSRQAILQARVDVRRLVTIVVDAFALRH